MFVHRNLLLFGLLALTTLEADEIFVTTTNDSGTGSFQSALQAAEPGDFIIFDPSLAGQTIFLQSSLPSIDIPLRILGPAEGNTKLHGGGTYPIFNISSSQVFISNLDLHEPLQDSPGGAIHQTSQSSAVFSNIHLHCSTDPLAKQAVFVEENAEVSTVDLQFTSINIASIDGSATSEFLLSSNSTLSLYSSSHSPSFFTVEGTGSINKSGPGSIEIGTMTTSTDLGIAIWEGTLSFSGTTTQPIVVGASGMLKGNHSCLYLVNQGTVNTGRSIGATTILNDYIQVASGSLEVEIAPSLASDTYTVGGNANLAGNLLILAQPGAYFKGSTITFMTTGGVVNGTFDTIGANSTGLVYRLNYFPTSLQIEFLQNLINFDGNVFSGNAEKVYEILANATVAPGSDLADVITALSALVPASTLENALNQLQPARTADLNWSSAATLHHIGDALFGQSKTFCGRNCSKEGTRDCCPALEKNGVWVTVLGERVRQGTLDSLLGFRTTTAGALIGYDRALTDKATLGAAGGYTHSNLSWDHDGGRVLSNSFIGALYSAFCLGKFGLDVSVIGSSMTYDIKRKIESTGVDRTARSSPYGTGFLGHLGGQYQFNTHYLKLTPFVSGEYSYLKTGAQKEHEADSLNLHTEKFKTDFVRAEVGLDVREEFCLSWGVIVPAVSLSYVYFSPTSNTHLKTEFAEIPGSFTVTTTGHAFHEIAPAASLAISAGDAWITLAYEGEFASKKQDQAISLNVRVQF